MRRMRWSLAKVLVMLAASVAIPALHADSAAPGSNWRTYTYDVLKVRVTAPANWQAVSGRSAVAFRFQNATGAAGVGILKSARRGMTIDQEAGDEFNNPSRPADWIFTKAIVDHHRAIKIYGTDPHDAGRKIARYYVETPGGTYLVECQAPAAWWPRVSPIFAEILNRIQFLR
ncbi:MAG TPA: hypothetical protein VMU17_06545 [Elusimicrobiota bacterium]|nr:hypothetical protein [Elusimicrobiota bacterium]